MSYGKVGIVTPRILAREWNVIWSKRLKLLLYFIDFSQAFLSQDPRPLSTSLLQGQFFITKVIPTFSLIVPPANNMKEVCSNYNFGSPNPIITSQAKPTISIPHPMKFISNRAIKCSTKKIYN
ncbi:hypothetical protein RJT34_28307 [Clitoria ternatea]|uniref:Uncharacterized protein n=1 Tax=Clitoria ternatea TaxID=43366 RepID=A0AAN9IGU6_CLITE